MHCKNKPISECDITLDCARPYIGSVWSFSKYPVIISCCYTFM